MLWLFAALVVAGALLVMLPALLSRRAARADVDASASSLAVHRDQWREIERDVQAGWLDPARVDESRADVQRRVLDDVAPDSVAAKPAEAPPSTALALAIGLFVSAGSFALYLLLGNPGAARAPEMRAASHTGDRAAAAHAANAEQIAAMVTGLVERLKQRPDDADGWAMLARSYTVLGRFRDASAAFRRASELRPGNPALLADYADVIAMTQGRRLAGEPARLVQAALDVDPRHLKALSLAGSVAFEAKDYAAAQGYWQRALDLVPREGELARSLQGSLMQARQLEVAATGQAAPATRAGTPPAPVAVTEGQAPVATSAVLRGRVELSPELAARVAAGDTVFVFARAATGAPPGRSEGGPAPSGGGERGGTSGPRMPLAIMRQQAGTWPLAFTLDDTLAMAPGAKLSMHAQVVIGARISRSGNATPQAGDLVGDSGVVAHDAQDVRIRIDRVQP
jgi:cytochrome c-type biogenesis protein CcmH